MRITVFRHGGTGGAVNHGWTRIDVAWALARDLLMGFPEQARGHGGAGDISPQIDTDLHG